MSNIQGSDMLISRWQDLMNNEELKLTEEEITNGWHFCYAWDGLLVGPGMMEKEFCHCYENQS